MLRMTEINLLCTEWQPASITLIAFLESVRIKTNQKNCSFIMEKNNENKIYYDTIICFVQLCRNVFIKIESHSNFAQKGENKIIMHYLLLIKLSYTTEKYQHNFFRSNLENKPAGLN